MGREGGGTVRSITDLRRKRMRALGVGASKVNSPIRLARRE